MFKRISVADAHDLLHTSDNVTLIDIRDPQSYASHHPRGAQHLDNDTVPEFIANSDRTAPLLVLCYHGNSSQGAADYFVAQGFTDVYSVDGGAEAWRMAYPNEVVSNIG